MRLSLNGWPPVASHLACILIGTALAQVGGGKDAGSERQALPARKALLAFGKGEVLLVGTRPGQATRLARREGAGICLVDDTKVDLLHTQPQIVIAAALRTARAITAAAEEAAAGKLALVGETEARSYASCRKAPQVIYGTR
jgi:hypothetical protein